MRILTVGNMYPPHHYGGYEVVWKGAVDHLRARGDEVRVLTTDYDTGATEPDPPWVHRDLRFHFRDGEFKHLTPRRRVALARHNHAVLDRHLQELQPDVVSWWSMGGLTLTLVEAVRRRGIPAVGFVHDEWLDYGRWVDPWSSLFSGGAARRLAPLAERFFGIPATVQLGDAATYVFVSEAMRRFAIGRYLGLRRTAVAHSGIDPAYLEPADAQDWRWRLLYVGRLDARKGVDTAVEALVHLPDAARLRLIGGWDKNEEARLRELAGRLGVAERVEFSGQLAPDAVKRAYGECDAVVFPPRWREPWGLVPLEAMARGRPVVATGTGGSAEYLRHGENCLLFEAGNPRDLAEKLRRLADDADLRGRLRENGFPVAGRHTEPVFNESVARAIDAVATAPATNRRRNILHIGSGFRPFRHGGLTAYTEDLVNEQAARGHRVTYFFSGRHFPFMRGPRLRRWRLGAVDMIEVANSPLYDHGRQPELEVAEPRIEEMLRTVLSEVQPDVVSIQELAGLPSSVIDVVRGAGVRCVLTLHDYFPLCSTFKLLDSTGRVCMRRQIGEDCVRTTANGAPPGLMVDATVRHELHRRRLLSRFDPHPPHPRIDRIARAFAKRVPRPPQAPPEAFQRRRELNVERLNRSDLMVANSHRVAEIYAQLGVDRERIHPTQITVSHIEGLRVKAIDGSLPVRFATLNGLASEAKGARLVLDAVRTVHEAAPRDSFRVVVFGHVDERFAEEANALPPIEMRGPYGPAEIDGMLEDVDVGLMPSIWEEAYGFAGPEFLAKGIPLIANAIGGIVEYAREGETAWLNRSCSADEMATLMLRVIERPEQLRDLHETIVSRRDRILMPMARHADELERVYDELLAGSSA